MVDVHLVGCSKTKSNAPGRIPARERYTSPLFRLSLAAAEREAGAAGFVYIVSAEHRLLALDAPLEWYDAGLRASSKRSRIAFGQVVVDLLVQLHGAPGRVTIWAGAEYADPILRALYYAGTKDVRRPLHRLQVGDRLALLKLMNGAAP